MNTYFYSRREADLQSHCRKDQTAMVRPRLLLGSLALSHSLAAFALGGHNPPYIVSELLTHSWWLPILLSGFAGLMLLSAALEFFGYPQRALHEFSASMLATTWAVIWTYSWIGGADYITFLAPVHVFFIGWSVVSEARLQRTKLVRTTILT